jgi:hypothetical protein
MSPLLKVRQGGSWVETAQRGKVRIGGAWVDYGPADSGLQPLLWPNPPSLTNGDDDAYYNMGVVFDVNETCPCAGVEWYVPDTLDAPPGGIQVALWQIDPDARQRIKVISPVAGSGYSQFEWDDGDFELNPSFQYIASVLTGTYSFRAAAGGWGFTNAGGQVSAVSGRLTATSDPDVRPSSNFDSYYYVGPLIRV